MRWSVREVAIIILGSTLFALVPLAQSALSTYAEAHAAATCDRVYADGAEKIGCWLEIVYDQLQSGGLEAAFGAFDAIYERYPYFGATGCHTHAHKLGDAAYYRYFISEGMALGDMRFPQSATSCGYGFFHGFIEHYVQNAPNTKTATETCEYLSGELSDTMRDMDLVCYHASGHGFTQAMLDTLHESDWGDVRRLVSIPLDTCEALPIASPAEIEECREGVFNVVNEWSSTGDYGLSIDLEDPFKVCRAQGAKRQYACFYEYAQNVIPKVGFSPRAAEHLAASIAHEEYRVMAFGVMVAGMTQVKAPLDEYERLLDECVRVDSDFYEMCVISVANGMMEHGDPQDEYQKVMKACEVDALSLRGGRALCYRTLAERLSRFYGPEKKSAICASFPTEHRALCAAAR